MKTESAIAPTASQPPGSSIGKPGSGFPIGILTHNRAGYLEATLRSLSATILPDGTKVTVFDDGSTNPDSLRYLYTNEEIKLAKPVSWPRTRQWLDMDLGCLTVIDRIRGIAGRVPVVRSPETQGVVDASNWAIRKLFQQNPDAEYVCLLQDDIVLTEDWYQRLCTVCLEELENRQITLVSGCVISYTGMRRRPGSDNASFTSAQCLAIPRSAWLKMDFFRSPSNSRYQFDESLSRSFMDEGFKIRLLLPGCAQHIGVQSQVSPKLDEQSFLAGAGRFCHYSARPYAWSNGLAY